MSIFSKIKSIMGISENKDIVKTHTSEVYIKSQKYLLDETSIVKLSKIKDSLMVATKKHFSRLVEDNGEGNIYGYSLYTCDDATSVGPVVNRECDFQKEKNDSLYSYYRYGAQEWNLWDDYGFYDTVNTELRKLVEEYDDEIIDFQNLRQEIFTIFLSVLEALKREGTFKDMSKEPYLAVWVSDSDADIMSKSVKVLNSEILYNDYVKEYGV